MFKVIDSDRCSCGNDKYQYVKEDYYGTWIQCLKCQKQAIKKEVNVFFSGSIDDKEEIKQRFENGEDISDIIKNIITRKEAEIKKEKFQEEQRKEQLNNVFKNNYCQSKAYWERNLSDKMDEKAFNEAKVEFIQDYFNGWIKDNPDKEQAMCISEIWDDIQVVARAGSGKTSTIVNRAAFLIQHCNVLPSEMLILAFNKKAAKSLQEKLKEMLEENAPQAMTFHSLAYSIVHPEENLLKDSKEDGFEKSALVQEIIDDYIRDQYKSKKIMDFMFRYFREEWEQIINMGYHMSPFEMVNYRKSISYIGLDGGYYKSMSEKRIADYLFEHDVPYKYERNFRWGTTNYKPDFTISLNNNIYKGIIIEYFGLVGNKGYDEQIMKKRNFWKMKQEYIYIEITPKQGKNFQYLDELLKEKLKSYGFKMKKLSDEEIWFRIKDRAVGIFSMLVSQFIGLCRKKRISSNSLMNKMVQQYPSLSQIEKDFLKIVLEIYNDYMQSLEMNGKEDFDGLLERAIKFICHNSTKWTKSSKTGDLKVLKYLFIDEYQDFSLLFYEIVESIKKLNPNVKIFCVGDDWQAINGFAGSDLRYFENFNRYFPSAKILNISSNYRSCSNIVEMGNHLMKNKGVPSKSTRKGEGFVGVIDISKFIPHIYEQKKYAGDVITPVLIRTINYLIHNNQYVTLLFRKNNRLPWYVRRGNHSNHFQQYYMNMLRSSFPKDKRHLIKSCVTTHSFKGKEEDAIIIVDAVDNSYPLVHPTNIFFRILGRTIEDVILEEERLFYVALTRAKNNLIIITEHEKQSPFLLEIMLTSSIINEININRHPYPKRKENHYKISIVNKYSNRYSTMDIKSYLKEWKYQWSSVEKAWIKYTLSKKFSKDKLLDESWISYANNVLILIEDEDNNQLYKIEIENGVAKI